MQVKCPQCRYPYDFREACRERDLLEIIGMSASFGKHGRLVSEYVALFDTTRPIKAAKMQKLCDEFNQKYPVGTPVRLHLDFADWIPTKVKHAAEILSGHTAVAWFEGVSGCYAIEGRVRAAVFGNFRRG
jgi:hypothetical protein